MKELLTDFQHSLLGAPEHRHCHLSCEMIYIKAGLARFSVGGQSFQAGEGSLVLISSLEEHEVTVLQTPYERYFAILNLPELMRAFPRSELTRVFLNRPEGFSHKVEFLSDRAQADGIFAALEREYAQNPPCARQMAEALLLQLLVLFLRACPGNFTASRSVTADRVLKAQRYMEEHFTQEITVTDLAKRFFVSPCHLTHSFKQQVGYSPRQYLRLMRLSYAKELLQNTNLSIADVALKTGFAEPNNFIRAFRESYEISPGRWRKESRLVLSKEK